MTTRPHIRTVSDIRPEWYAIIVSSVSSPVPILSLRHRLLEYAKSYFDLSTFQDGETKRALQRLVNKWAGNAAGRLHNTNGDNGRRNNGR